MTDEQPRVLHLIDPGSPGGGGCTLRLLAEPLERIRSVEQDVFVLGTARHLALAERCGVRTIGHMAMPTNVPVAGRRGLERVIRTHEVVAGRYDIIHAWSPRAAIVAMLAAPERRRLATFTVGPVTGFATDVFMRLLRRHPMPILACSAAVEREYRSLGVDKDLLSVYPPAVNPESVESIPRKVLRRRWGLGNKKGFVVGLLSEPATWADARIAAEVVVRMAVTGRQVRLLVHEAATRRSAADRWLRHLNYEGLIVADPDVAEPWKIVRGLDAALLIGGQLNSEDMRGAGTSLAMFTGGGRRLRPMPGILPLLWAMSTGVPVIAEDSDAVRDIIDDGVDGMLVNQRDISAACDRLIKVCDDRTIAGRLGVRARERIAERYHVSAFCVRLKDVYERLLEDRPVRVVSEYEDVVEVA